MFPKRFPALQYRDYRIYAAAQLISNIGSQMQFVALNWHIYELTHSPFLLGLIGLCRFVPIVLFSLIGGTVADAHNRKNIVLVTQIVMASLAAILGVLTLTGSITPAFIFIITMFSAGTMAFDMPAMASFVPSLVEKKDLHSAISLNSLFFQTSVILGPAIGGILIGHFSPGVVYVFNAISFVFVIIGLLLMHTKGSPGTGQTPSIALIADGLHFIRSKTIIWSTMLLDFFSTFFASATALLPVFAKDILHVGPTQFGLLYSAPSIGAVIAAVFIAQKGKLRKQGLLLLTAVLCFGLATICFGISKNYVLSLFFLSLVGAGDEVSTVIRNTVRQLETPDLMRGRMTSINMIFFMGGPQLGDFEAGALAGFIGAPLSVVIGGVGTMIVVGIFYFAIPRLRNYDSQANIQ